MSLICSQHYPDIGCFRMLKKWMPIYARSETRGSASVAGKWQRLLGCEWQIFYTLMILVLADVSTTPAAPASPVAQGSPHTSSSTASPTPRLGAPECHPPSPLDTSNLGFLEARGTATGTQLWALFLGGVPPAGTEIKIIWRATDVSTQQFRVSALGPRGLHVQPRFGPELHSGSDCHRPGREGGTGFRFPVAGCWDLHVTDEDPVGDGWIVVPSEGSAHYANP